MIALQQEVAAKLREVQKEKEIYEALNQQLRANQHILKADLAAVKEAAAKSDAEKHEQLDELTEQVTPATARNGRTTSCRQRHARQVCHERQVAHRLVDRALLGCWRARCGIS